ncbi:hypothetical protein QBC41DRAFT_379380 [Cercophora samala]|uniref:Uncharacterized protein n=1 Tax=Cercophora samala TaxID=330535 RepID=A0AA39Z7C8_9PEZI|nr:hypothetical protein QBC41DRAFT_379380 [Cercophora samala]
MNLLDLDPCPTILVLITLRSTIYYFTNSTEKTSIKFNLEGDTGVNQPVTKATTFAHPLKTASPSITQFLRSLDAICLNHIFFSSPELFQGPDVNVRSYQSTSSIIWNSTPPMSGKAGEEAKRLAIYTIPSPSCLSEQLEMIKLRGNVDTVLVEMAVQVEERYHEVAMNNCEDDAANRRLAVAKDKDMDTFALDMDFKGLAKECLRVLERMGGEERLSKEQV